MTQEQLDRASAEIRKQIRSIDEMHSWNKEAGMQPDAYTHGYMNGLQHALDAVILEAAGRSKPYVMNALPRREGKSWI